MTRRDTGARDRMVYSAVQLVRARGMNATGVRDVVDDSGAPRGSFQHYFPGGKEQLLAEAVRWSGQFAAEHVRGYGRTARRPTPAGLFAHMAAPWKDEFDRRGFDRGCPLMATAAEVVGTDSGLNDQLRLAADEWLEAVEAELVAMSVHRSRARTLATLMVGSLEGAIMLARIRHDTGPLTAIVRELRPLLTGGPGPRR
jgi:AcrR family transcriptional regulator